MLPSALHCVTKAKVYWNSSTMFVLLVLLIVIALVFIRYRQMTILKRNGIPGPQPNYIYGSMKSFFKKPNVERYDELLKNYGNICGYYIGQKPSILVCDMELIKRIQIKDFHNFSDRQNFGVKHGLRPNPKFTNNIISSKGSKWKETRTILNPTFSASKLKAMTPIIDSSINILVNKVDQKAQSGEEFDIYNFFQTLTTDVIAKCALGIDTNVQNNPEDKFFKAAQEIFNMKPNFLFMMFTCFPALDIVFYPIRRFMQILVELSGKSPNMIISKMVKAAIKLRQHSTTKHNDLLQLMLDATVSEDDINNTNVASLSVDMSTEVGVTVEKNGVTGQKERKLKSLDQDEVIINAIIFYEAGYETTSTALAFIVHVLVNNPDIQEKVRKEVLELYEKEKEFNYNTVNKLSYMQCVINETLRYYPPITSFVTRNTLNDYPYKNITIPKGATVRIPTIQIHHNEEFWPNHNVFDPERFADKKNYDPVAFQPFGNGPRNCIGMRFALYEIKLALSKLLFKYRLVPGPSTEKDISISYKSISQTPKYGVFLKAVPL